MRTKIVSLLAFMFFITLNAQDKKWTLVECVNYALDNNITIKQNKLNVAISEENLVSSKGNFLPSLSANANQSLSLGTVELYPGNFADRTFHSTSFGINVSQNVFSGFRNKLIYEQSKLGLEKGNLEQGKLIDDIGLFVVNTYLNILFNKENLEIAKAQYAFSEKQLKQVKDFYIHLQNQLLGLKPIIQDTQQIYLVKN